jgi:hypothetical protein
VKTVKRLLFEEKPKGFLLPPTSSPLNVVNSAFSPQAPFGITSLRAERTFPVSLSKALLPARFQSSHYGQHAPERTRLGYF